MTFHFVLPFRWEKYKLLIVRCGALFGQAAVVRVMRWPDPQGHTEPQKSVHALKPFYYPCLPPPDGLLRTFWCFTEVLQFISLPVTPEMTLFPRRQLFDISILPLVLVSVSSFLGCRLPTPRPRHSGGSGDRATGEDREARTAAAVIFPSGDTAAANLSVGPWRGPESDTSLHPSL